MIDATKATQEAADFLKQIYDGATAIRVEELELPEDEQHLWKVTLSYIDAGDQDLHTQLSGTLAQLVNPGTYRLYKTFDIDSETGAVKRMKIRKTDQVR